MSLQRICKPHHIQKLIAPRALAAASLRIAPAPIAYSPRSARLQQRNMSSVVTAAAKAAHSAVASLASAAPIKAGDKVPDVEIRINDLEDKINFAKLDGKNVLVLVPGAYSPTCSSQIPSYVEAYSSFTAKGVKGIYVVTVNDMFVVKAWKKDILQEAGKEGEQNVQFTADDQAAFAHGAGLVLDAQAIFGGPRLKRGAIVIEDGVVKSVAVEENPGEVTVTHAQEVLKTL